MQNVFVCPCCGKKLIVSQEGAGIAVCSFFDEKENQTETAIQEKLAEYGYEFGVQGGENE